MDELARELKLDPFALRRQNYVEHDQQSGKPYSRPEALRLCCEHVRERFNWEAEIAVESVSPPTTGSAARDIRPAMPGSS